MDIKIQNHGKWNADENNQLKSLDTITLYRPILSQSRASKVYKPSNKRKCLLTCGGREEGVIWL